MRTSRFLMLCAVLVLVGCGQDEHVEPTVAPIATKRAEPAGSYEVEVEEPTSKPPNQISLRLPGGDVEKLTPWTYCLPGVCADGWRGDGMDLFSVGSPSAVDFTFGVPGWDFEATLVELGDAGCLRRVPAKVVRLDEHTFRVFPAGPPGEWVVDLFGRGDGGDVSASFRWTTPSSGELPLEATGQVSVLADHDGRLDSYGVELGVSNLDRLPERVTATIEVTSDNGRSTIVDLGTRQVKCDYDAGGLYLTRQEPAQAAIDLGGTSFTYVVHLQLDDKTYTGTAHWPDDTNPEITPAVPLVWEPALPGYTG